MRRAYSTSLQKDKFIIFATIEPSRRTCSTSLHPFIQRFDILLLGICLKLVFCVIFVIS